MFVLLFPIRLQIMEREQAFYKIKSEPASFWSKLTRQKPEKNAVIDINNLLSEKPIMEVQAEDIQQIMDKYNLNLYKNFDDGSLRELYKTYLRYCFDDNHLNEDEIIRLKHLKRLLGLSDKAVEIANHQICQEVYERELHVALEDNRLDKKEILFLKQLQSQLHLPQELADTVYQNKAQSIIINFIKGAIADERLSPDEEAELQTLIDNLDVDPQLDATTQAELAKYRLFWQIENSDIPSIYVPVRLKPEEHCYFLADAQWFEEKRKRKPETTRVPLKIKLLKGSYWKTRKAEEMDLSESRWKPGAEGKIYITSERILLRKKNQEESIRLENIHDYFTYSNGLYIHKEKGRNLFLQFASKDNRDVFVMILGRVLREL